MKILSHWNCGFVICRSIGKVFIKKDKQQKFLLKMGTSKFFQTFNVLVQVFRFETDVITKFYCIQMQEFTHDSFEGERYS